MTRPVPSVLITGIQGQTGSYLADNYVSSGWHVHGTANIPKTSLKEKNVHLHSIDFEKRGSLKKLLESIEPELVINLAAVSSVAESWKRPVETFSVNASAVAEIAAYISELPQENRRQTRVIQASSSEIFGNPEVSPQTELTPLRPSNPYGASKAAAHMLGQTYRAAGFHWSNCILYNHESPRRPASFLSRKVSLAVARISLGLQDTLELGALDSQRDWGWAPDYAEAISLVAALEKSDDFIIASGISHSVEELVVEAFAYVGITDWKSYVTSSAEFIRPKETKHSVGDSSKLRKETGWVPTVSFTGMVHALVDSDIVGQTGLTR
ncbi:MAG: GDP-mannose 4,6-dehydratase [Actinomycetales bacterium]|nr:GDP-mannose 4,6-dehydratase [Actinomycetales bacterium]